MISSNLCSVFNRRLQIHSLCCQYPNLEDIGFRELILSDKVSQYVVLELLM